MAKYTKRPDFSSVYIPGFGQLAGSQEIEGDFDRFVPTLLVKVAGKAPTPAPPTPAPAPAALEIDEVEISVEDPAPKPAPIPAGKTKPKK